jgi:hypothetical protein
LSNIIVVMRRFYQYPRCFRSSFRNLHIKMCVTWLSLTIRLHYWWCWRRKWRMGA